MRSSGWSEQGNSRGPLRRAGRPLLAARRAGIPGFLMTNFTWADIYAPHARRSAARRSAFVAELRRAYRAGHGHVSHRAGPADVVAVAVIDVGMVVNQGRDRRAELRRLFGPEEVRQAGLPLHRPIRPKRPRLVAAGAVRGRGRAFRGYPPAPDGGP